MGVIVGGDAGGTSIGMAPGARWIAAKIFNDSGTATSTAIHLAFQWLLDPDHDPATADAPNIVNGSWSYGSMPAATSSSARTCRRWSRRGITPGLRRGQLRTRRLHRREPGQLPGVDLGRRHRAPPT